MIQKLTLVSVVAVLCLVNKAIAQNFEIVPFQIGERVPDLPLKNIINYKDSAATFSSFGDKLIILDFWNTHCTTCIKMFPLEDSLQAMLSGDVQFILVTSDKKEDIILFLEKYKQKHGSSLRLPILAGDNLLHKLFLFTYIPHYVWISPTGQILAQSSHSMIALETLKNAINWSKAYINRLRSYNLPDNKFVFPPVSPNLTKRLEQINN